MRIPSIILALSFASAAVAADSSETNSPVFHRTPSDSMREMSTDRLGFTDAPYTVNAGHLQMETGVAYSGFVDHSGPVRFEETSYGWASNIKLGLCERAEVQVQGSYTEFHAEATAPFYPGKLSASEHYWTLTPGLKVNLVGNDEGPFALAVIPYSNVPLNVKGRKETYGLNVPFQIKLPKDFAVRVMTGFQTVRFEDYRSENSINLSKRFDKLTLYTEFVVLVPTSTAKLWAGLVGFGGTYQLTTNFQLDTGVSFGVKDYDVDYNPYVGFSYRF